MYMELREVADVISGYTFRGAVKSDPNGTVFVFQAKDLIQGQPMIDVRHLTKIAHDASSRTGALKKNDVLLVARGMKSGLFRSTVFASEEKSVIASSSIHIIRATDSRILPEFISLYLNSKQGQAAILDIVTGSYIGAIPRKKLERLKIPLLPLAQQKIFIQLEQNIRKQEKIREKQNQLRQNIMNATFQNFITTSS